MSAASDPLRFGIVAQIEHTGIAVDQGRTTSTGLDDGLALLVAAEDAGLDVAYVRTRHLQGSVSSPLMVLAVMGQHLRRLQLGTAVIPLRFENPGRLAEDLATADLLLGGRLRPGVSSGYSAHDAMYTRAFGLASGDRGADVDRRLRDLLSFLDGEIVASADEHIEDVDAGSTLRVQPQAPGLRQRVAYGAAGPERAAMAGHAGLGLQLATMVPDDGSGRSFEQLQLEVLRAYREASRAGGHGDGHVMVSRQMLPVATEEDLEQYVSLIPRERTSAPGVSAEHRAEEIGGRSAVFSEVVIDGPSVVAQSLISDAVVQAADELCLVLPFGAPLGSQRRVMETFADQVVPHLLTAIV